MLQGANMNEMCTPEFASTPQQPQQPYSPITRESPDHLTPRSGQHTLSASACITMSAGPTVRDFTLEYEVEDAEAMQLEPAVTPPPPEVETDPHRLAQRQKQVDFGKNTLGYQRYIEAVPKESRRTRNGYCMDPATPDVYQKCSKRCFDGQIKKWRRDLHSWDPDSKAEDGEVKEVEIKEEEIVEEAKRSQLPDMFTLSENLPDAKVASDRKRGFEKAFKGAPQPGCMFAPLGQSNRSRR